MYQDRKHNENSAPKEGLRQPLSNLRNVSNCESTPLRHPSYMVSTQPNIETEETYNHRLVSPLSQFSPSGCDMLDQTTTGYGRLGMTQNYNEMNKSFNSG
jgi:hypothetical protein